MKALTTLALLVTVSALSWPVHTVSALQRSAIATARLTGGDVFLLGELNAPPAASGGTCSDVPTGYCAASWVEQLAREGITAGCGDGQYCPDRPLMRAELAIFLTRTFDLP